MNGWLRKPVTVSVADLATIDYTTESGRLASNVSMDGAFVTCVEAVAPVPTIVLSEMCSMQIGDDGLST